MTTVNEVVESNEENDECSPRRRRRLQARNSSTFKPTEGTGHLDPPPHHLPNNSRGLDELEGSYSGV